MYSEGIWIIPQPSDPVAMLPVSWRTIRICGICGATITQLFYATHEDWHKAND